MNALGRYRWVLLGALAVVACEEKKPDAAAAAPAAAPAPISDDHVAVPADFEEQAAQEINEDNAEQELSKLEQEVSTE